MLQREQLHGYQTNAITKIIQSEGFALFLDMGMGKTITSLTAIADLMDMVEVRRVLVVAPNKVIKLDTWQAEIKNWAHVSHLTYAVCAGPNAEKRKRAAKADVDIVFVNWENLVWLIKYTGKNWPFDMIVLDESSKTKNPDTKTFRALKAVRNKTRRMLLLTGSPAANSLLNLWSQMYLLDFGQRLGKTFTGYKQRYFDSDYMGYTLTIKDEAEDIIFGKISDLCMSLKAEDYLEVPDVIEVTHEVDMDDDVRKRYTDFEREQVLELIGDDDDITAVNAAVLSNKLLQFTSGAMYTDEKRNYTELHTAKLDTLEEIIENMNGKPVLLAYYYQHELDRIKARFGKRAVVLGSDPETLNKWNRGEIEILVANPASAGHGINAQKGGNQLVWFSYPNWDLELYEQFTARIVRQGQPESTVVVHHLVTPNTNDERVLSSLKDKDNRQQRLFSALKARAKEIAKNTQEV